jgi:hypothetical protein
MPTPATPLPIPETAQEIVVQFLSSAQALYAGSYNIRSQLLERDRAYYREQDQTPEQWKAANANANGDPNKIQNITIPVVMPQVESALTYLSDTFLTGYPIFGVVAPPAQVEALGQFETLIGENSILAAWPQELMKVMRDGLKYDLGAVEVVWEERKTFNIEPAQLEKLAQGKVKETLYAGTYMKHLSPYNLILDTRVSPDKNHLEGEYAGYTEMLSRIETKKRMADLNILGTMNFTKAWESGTPVTTGSQSSPVGNFYVPQINPGALLPESQRTDFDWMQWASLSKPNGAAAIAYRNSYEWTVLYARIIPRELGMRVPDGGEIQIWKFIIINRQVVIFAERQTNAHNYLPIIVCKPSNDGLGWQSKSFAENATPYQQLASALTNSALSSQRRKVYDRILYDPTKIRKQDIDNTSPVARIPVKNSQFGKGIQDAVYPFPYRDDGVPEILQMAQQVVSQAEVGNGQNRVTQGQFQKGNKTRSEFETVMNNSSSRPKMMAIGLEYSFWAPIKMIVKSNILQYQPPVTIINSQSKESITVDPAQLRKALISFQLSDGLLPSSKIIDPALVNTLFQAAPAMPQIQAEYDLMGMLAYSLALQGGSWINDFKRNKTQQQEALTMMGQAADASGSRDKLAQQQARAAQQQAPQE